MRYNQFSYIPTSLERAAEELKELGFDLDLQKTAKANLESFLRKLFFHYPDSDYPLSHLIAKNDMDALSFFLIRARVIQRGF